MVLNGRAKKVWGVLPILEVESFYNFKVQKDPLILKLPGAPKTS